MNTKHEITLAPGNQELVIREGKALDIPPVTGYHIKGLPGTVYEFLRKRKPEQGNCFIEHKPEELYMVLTMNAEVQQLKSTVTSSSEFSEEFIDLGLNIKRWTPSDLANHLRHNKNLVAPPTVFTELVALLRNYKAKIDKEVEKIEDTRANRTTKVAQVVESNLPPDIYIQVKLFRGDKHLEVFKCEVDIDPGTLEAILVWPDMKQVIDEKVTKLFNDEIASITAEFPGIVLFYF